MKQKKGIPNHLSQYLAQRLAQLGCNPIEGMAKIAMNPRNPVQLRGRMLAEIARYVYPKLRAVEISLDDVRGGSTLGQVLRIEKVEEKGCPDHDGGTLEDLCRVLWRQDKRKYLEMANGEEYSLRWFITQFERENVERVALIHVTEGPLNTADA